MDIRTNRTTTDLLDEEFGQDIEYSVKYGNEMLVFAGHLLPRLLLVSILQQNM